MVVGRKLESDRLDRLLADARDGQSGVLVLRGEAGIGKSSLLDLAAGRAGALTVLAARGAQAESELAFSALADLVRPILGHLEQIPEPQAAVLAGALAIGPPTSGDRFTICAATLSLLTAAAETSPLLVLVDDAQWLDASSLEALLFAARRLDSDAIAIVLAVRDGHPTALDDAGLPELRLTALSPKDSRTLLAESSESAIAAAVADRLLEAAAGNPLALIELPTLLSPAQLSGSEEIESEFPVAATIERAFLQQVAALPDTARRALAVAAASDTGDVDTIVQALLGLGLDPGSLDAAERAGLVSAASGRLEFRHPLLRAAVYHEASSIVRAAAHRALAEAAGGAQQAGRRAWHLAAASPTDDEATAQALEDAAVSARSRGGHAEAAAGFERAALAGADGPARVRRLREAAADAWLVGSADTARRLLDSALAGVSDPVARAEIQQRRGAVEMWHGSPLGAGALLADEAGRVEEVDPARAARMFTDAAWARLMAGDITAGRETAERARAAGARVGGAAEAYAQAAEGIALLLAGRMAEAVPLFAGYQSLLSTEGSGGGLYQPLRPDGQILTWVEQYDRAREVLERMCLSAREQSALGALPYALAGLSELDFRTGNWPAAYAGAAEAAQIAAETGQSTTLAFSLGCLARVEAAQGRADDCRVHAAQAAGIGATGIGAVNAYAGSALGLLELGLGSPAEAIAHLEPVGRRIAARGLREPSVVHWAPDLIEAYARMGRSADAERELVELEQLAAAAERTSALAAAGRCRGLLASDAEFESHFERALGLYAGLPTPFERARTELCLGERRRRARRRVDAREPLRAALETFDRLGARPWSERAQTELLASGETVGSRDPYTVRELTPQELQVALLVGRGATNKEAGASLFLSPKTIETHLGRVYRKLGVRSRSELAHRLGSEGALVL